MDSCTVKATQPGGFAAFVRPVCYVWFQTVDKTVSFSSSTQVLSGWHTV